MQQASGFRSQVAIVVGGTTGMGNAVVRQLVAAGCKTHVLDVHETTDAAFHHCDIRDHSQVQSCIAELVAREGRIDLLFIAAGVHHFATLEDTSLADFERVMSVNVNGTFHVLKEVLPVMRAQQYGNIVLMGSDQAFVGKARSAVYGMSKAAVAQLTKSLAVDYTQHNIRINCICPGTIETPMIRSVVERIGSALGLHRTAVDESMRTAQLVQRFGTPEEIGKAVMFLLSDDCRFMTGSLISVDGGFVCQ